MTPLLLGVAAFAGVPGVTVETYPVRGDTVEAIRAALGAGGPTDANDGTRQAAATRWHIGWRWPGTEDGPCDLAGASVDFAATVTLPELVGWRSLPLDLRAAWRRYRAALEAHEANHVRYAYDHRDEVLAAIQAATCATAVVAGRDAVDRLVEHDLAYDRDTAHGASEGATFP